MKNANADMSAQDLLAALDDAATPAAIAYFTAPWCQPCGVFAPVIEQLAQAGGSALPLYKINIDKYPEVAARFGVRGIPATLLLKQGAARERVIGAKSMADMRAWLAGEGVQLATGAAAEATAAPEAVSPRLQAFYGDAGLRAFLLARLGDHLDGNQVRYAFRPYWVDGAGTFSAALVESADAEVFTRLTNLSFGMSCVMDFLDIRNRADAERLFAAIGPSSDLAGVPLRFVRAWLEAPEQPWSDLLVAPGLDQLRRDWLAASGRWLAGDPGGDESWSLLRSTAEALTSDKDPTLQLDDDVATMLALLSPPPPPGDSRWMHIITARATFSRARLLEFAQGWSRHEIALPLLKMRWVQDNVTLVDGNPEPESLARALRENPYNDAAADAKRDESMARFSELCEPVNRRFLDRLIEILTTRRLA
ncbi:thioredoxin family protein [Duganella sp. BJB1802]|nr:thioredoxin family protein [Duganella sp. BJB1802]